MNTKNIVCPSCQALNRIPENRLNESPKCGRCHASIFTQSPIILTNENFNAHAAKNDIPLLVDFWASWCGPCKMMAPAFQEAARSLEPNVRLGKINTEEQQNLAAQYQIRSIPTLALFQHGREIARQPGAMGAQDIVNWVRLRLS